MTRPLRIAIADDEPDMRDYFARILPLLGHRVVAVAADGEELVEKCLQTQPDLVITDVKMPRLDGIDAAVRLYEQMPVPVILVSAYHGRETINRAEADHVMAYLVKPIKQADLAPAIALATHRFEQFEQLRQEAADLKEAFEDRRVIEQAKGVLMAKESLDEAAAFQRLQQIAGDGGVKLVEAARGVVRGGSSRSS
jgi:response regulator NasT